MALLDILCAPLDDYYAEDSLNRHVGPATVRSQLVGTGVGNLVAHEAGHFFGNMHTDPYGRQPNLMDPSYDLAGPGPDGIFGTPDDDIDFGESILYYPGDEEVPRPTDTLDIIAFGLPTGRATPPEQPFSPGRRAPAPGARASSRSRLR